LKTRKERVRKANKNIHQKNKPSVSEQVSPEKLQNEALWNKEDERFYREYRSEMRERLTEESTTGPWEQVMLGFLRNVPTPSQVEKANEKTPKLSTPKAKLFQPQSPLELYKVISYSLKLLKKVNGMPFMNNNLNRKEFQKRVDCLSEDDLDQIETELAEKIIQEYDQEKKDIQLRRHSFLKEK